MYNFVRAIEAVIEKCINEDYGKVQSKDENGRINLWLEAKWVTLLDNIHEIIELYICFIDTGRPAYSTYIKETKREIGKEI